MIDDILLDTEEKMEKRSRSPRKSSA